MKTLLATAAALAVASSAVPAHAAVNLVTNGSFESGAFGPGWTQFGDTSVTGVFGGTFFDSPTDGAFQAAFGPVFGFGGITQTLTSSATSYLISFDLGNLAGSDNYVEFGGTTILSNIANTNGAWTNYSFTATAGANPTLTFGFFNPPSFYVLDNVSVTEIGAVPEPATWALMIVGFGIVGARLRRQRKQAVRVTYA